MTSSGSTATYSLEFSDTSAPSHRSNAINKLFSQKSDTFNSTCVPMVAKDSYGDWIFEALPNRLHVQHPITRTSTSNSVGGRHSEDYDKGDGYDLSVRCETFYHKSQDYPTDQPGHIRRAMIPEGVTLDSGKSEVHFVPSSGQSLSNIFRSEKKSDMDSSSVNLKPLPVPPKVPTSLTAEPMTVKRIPGRFYFARSKDGSVDTDGPSLERDVFMTVGTTGRVKKG